MVRGLDTMGRGFDIMGRGFDISWGSNLLYRGDQFSIMGINIPWMKIDPWVNIPWGKNTI